MKKYDIEPYLISLAGSIRFIGQTKDNRITSLEIHKMIPTINISIITALLKILVSKDLLEPSPKNVFIIQDELKIQRLFEFLKDFLSVDLDELTENIEQQRLFWTPPLFKEEFMNITSDFGRIDTLIQDLIERTRQHLIIAAPYYSEAGIRVILESLKPLLLNQNLVKVNFFCNSLINEKNKMAFNLLKREFEDLFGSRIKVYIPTENRFSDTLKIHVKCVLSDSCSGYLGSANFSYPGLSSQFEVGVMLSGDQSKKLELTFMKLLKMGYFILS